MPTAFSVPASPAFARNRLRSPACARAPRVRVVRTPRCTADRDLYADLGLPGGDASVSQEALKAAYRGAARRAHPDGPGAAADEGAFERAASAWAVLGDRARRATYDALGWAGVAALDAVDARAAQMRAMGVADSDADFLADSGALDAALLEPAALRADRPARDADADDDACPRSVPEALWNIEFHPDSSVRYYGLWWVYRFKVTAAEPALVRILRDADDSALRRRAALALGAVAAPPNPDAPSTVTELAGALQSPDYYLRYRAAEALANIARRHADVPCVFPDVVLNGLLAILENGRERLARKAAAKSGFSRQESMFDLEKLEPAVREKLVAVFEGRRQNEMRSRRTTMTPQLGVDEVDAKVDEPFEWVLKAAGTIAARGTPSTGVLDTIRFFADHEIPLVRYAAHKSLYALTGEVEHARVLIQSLGYGIEHHYSQRVVIRDLGDLGYADGAQAVAECPMVENSFKVLALKNMLSKRNNDPQHPDVRNVLKHMDSLL